MQEVAPQQAVPPPKQTPAGKKVFVFCKTYFYCAKRLVAVHDLEVPELTGCPTVYRRVPPIASKMFTCPSPLTSSICVTVQSGNGAAPSSDSLRHPGSSLSILPSPSLSMPSVHSFI